MNKNATIVLLLVLAAGCTGMSQGPTTPQLDPARKVSEQDCSQPFDTDGGNLKCREVTEAERRAKIEEAARLARARKEAAERAAREKKEAEERAARERLERERAEQLAREEAARKLRAAEEERLAKLRAAEEERLAAERRRLAAEAEAARKAQEERERKEREEAEFRARQLAEQQAREAAARECRRLEQLGLEGRAQLANFVATYGKDEEFKEIGGEISTFLAKARDAKPCPPAS